MTKVLVTAPWIPSPTSGSTSFGAGSLGLFTSPGSGPVGGGGHSMFAAPVGGGGASDTRPTLTGPHTVESRCWTSKSEASGGGYNNPGDIGAGPWANENGAVGNNGGFAVFATEQAGRYALGTLLDANYGNNSISNFAFIYNPNTPQHPNQAQIETSNIELYMEQLGYTNFGSSIQSMSNAEFNSFLDAITHAEGRTNMSC